MSDKHGKNYNILASRNGKEQVFQVRGGGKGIKLTEQLEADGWTIIQIKQIRGDKRHVSRRRDYGDED